MTSVIWILVVAMCQRKMILSLGPSQPEMIDIAVMVGLLGWGL